MQIQVGDSAADKALGTWESLKLNSIDSSTREQPLGWTHTARSGSVTGHHGELCFLNSKSKEVKQQQIKSRNGQRPQRSWVLSD